MVAPLASSACIRSCSRIERFSDSFIVSQFYASNQGASVCWKGRMKWQRNARSAPLQGLAARPVPNLCKLSGLPKPVEILTGRAIVV
jgi:hypothetical protein